MVQRRRGWYICSRLGFPTPKLPGPLGRFFPTAASKACRMQRGTRRDHGPLQNR